MTTKPMNKIDLSVIVGQQVLCQFWEDSCPTKVNRAVHLKAIQMRTGFLDEILQHPIELFSVAGLTIAYIHCRIYPDYWISNHDGRLVLPDGLQVNCIDWKQEQWSGVTGSRDGIPFVYYGGKPVIMGKTELTHLGITEEMVKESPEQYCTNNWWMGYISSIQVIGVAEGWSY